jgi:hypothetical protein
MKIQIGEVLMGKVDHGIPVNNRTWKYLTPCLKSYGHEFEQRYNSVFKLALGLGDLVFMDNEHRYEKHLFILLDSRIWPKNFVSFLNWIRGQECYQDDYVYGDIKKSPCHMVVIKIPDQYTPSFEKFLQGKYSEMFTLADIDSFFGKHPETKKVLTKDNLYRIKFVRNLNKLFGTTLRTIDYEGELDLPPNQKEEYFE